MCLKYTIIIFDPGIMITINIIILYFKQIKHTDDFPSTGTRLVDCNSSMSAPIEAVYHRW